MTQMLYQTNSTTLTSPIHVLFEIAARQREDRRENERIVEESNARNPVRHDVER